jgi:hypothetical protein
MAGKIAILEGWKMPRRRRHRRHYGSASRTRGGGHARFRKAAKICSRKVRKHGGSYLACMRKHLKKHRRR